MAPIIVELEHIPINRNRIISHSSSPHITDQTILEGEDNYILVVFEDLIGTDTGAVSWLRSNNFLPKDNARCTTVVDIAAVAIANPKLGFENDLFKDDWRILATTEHESGFHYLEASIARPWTGKISVEDDVGEIGYNTDLILLKKESFSL